MPSMDGGELARQARMKHPQLPVLFMSGYSEHRPTAPAGELATTRFIAKPLTPARLAAEIRAVLEMASRLLVHRAPISA